MRRLLLVLLLMCFIVAPAAAFAQEANNAAEAVDGTTTTTTTTTSNVTESPDSPDRAGDADDPVDIDRSPIEASGDALLKLFVLAIILESALALFFNWRPIVARYDGRGIKAPITFAAALVLVFVFKPDAIASLMSGYGSDVGEGGRFFARVIEAMVIAGGSSGVNRLLIALGFRSQARAEEVVSRPRSNEAWISVGLDRQSATGPVYVEIKVGNKPAEIAGTITGTRAVPRTVFRRDYGRLPPAGGWSLPPGEEITVELVDQGGRRSGPWGPHRLAAGAIVDIDLVL